MGSSFYEETSEVDKARSISLNEIFEKNCAFYLSIGMTYEQYWYGDPYICKYYYDAYKIKTQIKDEEMHRQGMYYYEALCDVSPVLHAFSKKGTKPLPYSERPYGISFENIEKTEEEKEKEAENERLKAQLLFSNYFRGLKKKFEKEENNKK